VSGQKSGEFGLQSALRHQSDLLHGLQMEGFNYDGVDFWSVLRLAEVSKGRLLAGDGAYHTLILPSVVGIEIRTLQRIVGFCHSGGTVLITGRWPERSYGGRGPTAPARSRALLRELLGDKPDHAHGWTRACGRGRVLFAPDEQTEFISALRSL